MRVDKVKGPPPDFQSVERGVRLSLPAPINMRRSYIMKEKKYIVYVGINGFSTLVVETRLKDVEQTFIDSHFFAITDRVVFFPDFTSSIVRIERVG